MRKGNKWLLLILISLVAALVTAGCGSRSSNQTPLVMTAEAKTKEIENRIDLGGVLVPAQTVEIACKTSGQINTLGFKIGDRVKRGDVLIQLDTEALNGQMLAAEAGLQSARAAAEAASNQAAISKINLDAAQLYYDRTQQLYAAGAVSQSGMDDALDKLNIANQQYATASGPAQSQATAAVSSAYASLKNIQVQLGNTTIKSPLDGIITTQTVNPGQVISANTTVMTLVDTSTLKLKTMIGQDRIAQLTLGQTMDIIVDSYTGPKITGIVTSIGPIAMSTGEVFPLEITLKNDAGLMAGLSAHTTLMTRAQGLSVPADAVQQDKGESYVFVVADNVASRREVKTGIRNDREVLILEGLSEGEEVAIANLSILADGMQVKTQQE